VHDGFRGCGKEAQLPVAGFDPPDFGLLDFDSDPAALADPAGPAGAAVFAAGVAAGFEESELATSGLELDVSEVVDPDPESAAEVEPPSDDVAPTVAPARLSVR
jgi:hypothetical protein